jgi:hypothetical protein
VRRDLLRSDSVRAGIAAAAALVISVLTVVTLDALEISDSATVIALLLLPLLVFGVVSGKIQELTGPGGWGAKFAELKRQQDIQASDIESIRVALRAPGVEIRTRAPTASPEQGPALHRELWERVLPSSRKLVKVPPAP